MCQAFLRPILTAALLWCGHLASGAGSVSAAEPHPLRVATDLVELAVAIPDTVAACKLTSYRYDFAKQQVKKGIVSNDSVVSLRIESEAAQQKLGLLKAIIEAEIRAGELLQSRRNGGTSVSLADVKSEELRLGVLRQFLKEATLRSAPEETEDATSWKPAQGSVEGIVVTTGKAVESPVILDSRHDPRN